MTFWFLLIVGIAWVGVFVPAALRARETTPLSATRRFRTGMNKIAPATGRSGRWVVVPHVQNARARAFLRSQARRRRVLASLSVATGAAAPLALLFGGFWRTLTIVLGVTLVTYVTWLVGTKRQREEQLAKVRSIAPARPPKVDRDIFNEPSRMRAAGG